MEHSLPFPTYWKNGTLVTLSGGDATSFLEAIAVQGSTVYAVGVDDKGSSQTALFWQNGTAVTLNGDNNENTNTMAVAVNSSGQAVISGTAGSSLSNMQIGYWSPGTEDLTVLSSGEFVSTTTGVAVDASGNIYVCGSQFNTVSTPPSEAWYWKLNCCSAQATGLSDGSNNTLANAITLD